MKIICIRKKIFSHRKKNLLFLPCNMAAVQNLSLLRQWNPDFSNPQLFEPPDNLNQSCFPLSMKFPTWFLKLTDFLNQFFFPLEVSKIRISLYIIGSITSRCLGNEPALLPQRHSWTREASFVSLNQSDNCPQIFVGHKLSRQFGLRDDSSWWQMMRPTRELQRRLRSNV